MPGNNNIEKLRTDFSVLLSGYHFTMTLDKEEGVEIIVLENEHLKIALVEERYPRGIYNVTFYDGGDLWLGLPLLSEYVEYSFSVEYGCIRPSAFPELAHFLVENYSNLLLGDEIIKQKLIAFYKNDFTD